MSRIAPSLLAAALFAGVAFAVYAPARDGPFLSDDLSYVSENPWVQDPWTRPGAILRPDGEANVLVRNYAPVHLALHALGWQLFGADVRGHHALNVLVHVLACLALAGLWRRAGLAPAAALLGALVFAVHPANVEAVAWISQLKTTSALLLAVAALALRPRRPAASALVFGLALLAKPMAAVALAFATAIDLGAASPGERLRVARERRVVGLAAWWGVFALFAGVELAAFGSDEPALPVAADAATRMRTSLVIAGRYLWMAATGRGTSAFHEPAPVTSWLAPALLASLAALGLLSARAARALRRRRLEGAFWVWAAAGFVPVAQWLPFRFAMADRYLYFILPGLIGGLLLAGSEAAAAWPAARRRLAARVAAAAALALAAGFAVQSHARASIWKSPWRLATDAARHYPDGTVAALLDARASAAAGDVEASVAALRRMHARGWNQLDALLEDPAFARVREAPAFQALVRDVAQGWIDFLEGPELSQAEWLLRARAHRARGEREAALRALEQAARRAGPHDAAVRAERARWEGAPQGPGR
jgi:hypothetical protein